ncbi:hypothetical protein HD554DRAFT_2042922 [Boletus coccyginus]|nr:hypothetical protein HD554DRAFT_2042922 [Boletus coccyginus]
MARRAMVCDLCAKRDARAVSPLACPSGAPLQGSEPDHGKPCTVQAEVDKEGAGSGVRFRACESSRQGATATPTAVLPRPFRVPATNLKPYRGSWPNHEVARNGGGATPDRLVAMRVKRVGRGRLPARAPRLLSEIPSALFRCHAVPTVEHSTVGSLFAIREGFDKRHR